MTTLVWKASAAGAVVGFLVALVPLAPVFGEQATTSWKDFSTGGINWQNRSEVENDYPNTFTARVRKANLGLMGANKVGAKARIYYSTNVLCHATSMNYNPSQTSLWGASSAYNCGMSMVYSKGVTDTWNGTSFSTTVAPATREIPSVG